MWPEPTTELNRLLDAAQRKVEEVRALGRRVAALRKQAHEQGWTDELRTEHDQAQAALREAATEQQALADQVSRASGTPEEIWVELERRPQTSDPIDRTSRASVRSEAIATTGLVEDYVAAALDHLLPRVDPSWWATQAALDHGLEPNFLDLPLSLTRGVRVAGERRPVHRFAQMLRLSQHLLTSAPQYDWFAGATLTPQLAALGAKLPALAEVSGDVNERITALWRLPSDKTESTVYELVVAASCAEWCRDVEFLTAGNGKTPDLRVHDFPFPVVVECKRRQSVTDGDVAEDAVVRSVYNRLRPACLSRDMTGVVALRLTVPLESLPITGVVDASVRQRLTPDPRRATVYPWGDVAFVPQRRRIACAPTRV